MTDREKIGGIAVLVILAIAIFAGYSWLQEHDARKEAESQTKLQQQSIDALQKQAAQSAAALQTQVASIEKQKAAPVTKAQVVADATRDIPNLPEPLKVENVTDPELPNAPPQQEIVIPEADLKTIRDAGLTCQENNDKLASCTSQKANDDQQMKLMTQERDEWEKAAKGTFWSNLKRDGKWFGIGALTGSVGVVVAYEVNQHNQTITVAGPAAATKARK